MDSPVGPEVGGSDAQVDVAKIGTMWGPSLNASNARVRTAVAPNVVVEGEGGILHVTNEGIGPSRNAYTGRLGALWQSEDHRLALAAGVGGGTSIAAGQWGGVDVGAMIAGQHKHVRPVLSGDVGYSGPIGARREFAVDDDGSPTLLRLPRNFIGKLTFGFELGPTDCAVVLGMSIVKFWLRESSRVDSIEDEHTGSHEETFVAAGIGLRFKL